MEINLNNFYGLNFQEKVNILSQYGNYINSRKYGSYLVELYKISDFYIEVYRDERSNQIIKFMHTIGRKNPLNAYVSFHDYILNECLDVELYFLNEKVICSGVIREPKDFYSKFYWTNSMLYENIKTIPFDYFLENCITVNTVHTGRLLEFLSYNSIIPEHSTALCSNNKLKWSLELIIKYESFLNIDELFRNSALPKNDKYLAYFVNYTKYLYINYFNKDFQISTEIVKKYHSFINAIHFFKSTTVSSEIKIENFLLFVSDDGSILGDEWTWSDTECIYNSFSPLLPKKTKIEIITRIVKNGRLEFLNYLNISKCISGNTRGRLDRILRNRIGKKIYIGRFDHSIDAALKYIFIWNDQFLLDNNVYEKIDFYPEFKWTRQFILDYLSKKRSRYGIELKNIDYKFDKNFLDEIIEKFNIEKIDSDLNIEWSIEVIQQYAYKFSWQILSKNKSIPFRILIYFWEYVNMEYEQYRIEESKKFFSLQIGSGKLGVKPLEFIDNISEHIINSENDILDYHDILNFKLLSKNLNVHFNKQLLLKFEDKWDWKELSANTTIPIELLMEFKNNICIPTISSAHVITASQIRKWKNILTFSKLSENVNVLFDHDLIFEFIEQWDWVKLLNNQSINWVEQPLKLLNDGFELIVTRGIKEISELTNLTYLPWNSYPVKLSCSINQFAFLLNNVIIDSDSFINRNLDSIVDALLKNEPYYNKGKFNVNFKIALADPMLRVNLAQFLKSHLISGHEDCFEKEGSVEYFFKIGAFLNWDGYTRGHQHNYYYEANYISKMPDAELTLDIIKKYASKWKAGKVGVSYSEANYEEPGEWDFYLSNNKFITIDILIYLVDYLRSAYPFNIWALLIENGNFSWDYNLLNTFKDNIGPSYLFQIVKKLEKDSQLYNQLYEIVNKKET